MMRNLIVAVLLTTSLEAMGRERPEESSVVINCERCGEWMVGGHALYFAPITCPFAFGNVSNQTIGSVDVTDSKARYVPCKAAWGFRVFGNYLNDCLFAGMSYQRFEVTTTDRITATAITGGGIGGTANVVGQVGIEYQRVDVRVGAHLLQESNCLFHIYGNARWVDLSHRRAASYVRLRDGVSEFFTEKSALSGGAIGIGAGGNVDVWCGVGAFIDGNVLGVIGNRSLTNVKYKQFRLNPRDLQLTYPSDTCVIPEADFRIGLNYTYACGCWKIEGEVGYEMDYFWNGSAFPEFNGIELLPNSRAFVLVCQDLGFSGLFFGAHLIF